MNCVKWVYKHAFLYYDITYSHMHVNMIIYDTIYDRLISPIICGLQDAAKTSD